MNIRFIFLKNKEDLNYLRCCECLILKSRSPVYRVASTAATDTGFGGREIATDTSGNFFHADHFNNCIRMIGESGRVFVLAGNSDPVDKDGTGTEASFNGPQGITRDSEGNLYVTTYNYDTKGGNKEREISIVLKYPRPIRCSITYFNLR